jgi:hypothetical protein
MTHGISSFKINIYCRQSLKLVTAGDRTPAIGDSRHFFLTERLKTHANPKLRCINKMFAMKWSFVNGRKKELLWYEK